MKAISLQICILVVVTLSLPCSTQWAHTFGWGGAGNGKRSAPSYQEPQCQTDSDILRIVSQLIQVITYRFNFIYGFICC